MPSSNEWWETAYDCITDGLVRNIQVILDLIEKKSKQASKGGFITLFALCKVSA